MKQQITILPSHKIDVTKWDNCVDKHETGLIYATTVYLNYMAKNWHGLVVDDYDAILPLPWKKKFGISYLCTPPFTQQLGLIGSKNIATIQLEQAIQQFFKYGYYHFNFGNTAIAQQLAAQQKCNYTLDLNSDYATIKNCYKKGFRANLNKANKKAFMYTASNNFKVAIDLFKNYNYKNLQHVGNDGYKQLQSLCTHLLANNQLIIRQVIGAENELLCIVILLKDTKRFYNIINYTSIQGRANEANYFLYDNIFKEFANSPVLFDFEGSDLTGVKAFYESFGAVDQPYYQWHFNKLPWPLHLLKR